MIWLTILDNEGLRVLAETLVIIVGSMLFGILLSYFFWGGQKKEKEDLQAILDEEKRKSEDLRDQVAELLHVREHLKNDISEIRSKADLQAKTIYDQNQRFYLAEKEFASQKEVIDGLHAAIDTYQQRLRIIEEELTKAKSEKTIVKKTAPPPKVRANYEQVSQLLGRQVTENDFTLIVGIGPKTASLLHSHKIRTWEQLAGTPTKVLKEILEEAGGVYKSLDPASWSKQANMAAKSEWRKLRVFQEVMKKG